MRISIEQTFPLNKTQKALTLLSSPIQRSGTECLESVEPETCSRRSSCPPRWTRSRLSLWATAARWGRAAAAEGGGKTAQEELDAAAAEVGLQDGGFAVAEQQAAAEAAAAAGRGETQSWWRSPGADGGGPALGD